VVSKALPNGKYPILEEVCQTTTTTTPACYPSLMTPTHRWAYRLTDNLLIRRATLIPILQHFVSYMGSGIWFTIALGLGNHCK